MLDDNNSNNNYNIKRQQQQSPIKKLSGLRQAIYIMRCLSKGEYFEQITEKFDGDEQLVKLWMSFLLHNKCIQNPLDHKWVVTEKGKRWIEKYEGGKGNTKSGSGAAAAN
jgi:hypothetical protein